MDWATRCEGTGVVGPSVGKLEKARGLGIRKKGPSVVDSPVKEGV